MRDHEAAIAALVVSQVFVTAACYGRPKASSTLPALPRHCP